MIQQTKVLKTLLKKHNITDTYGKLSVRVERYTDGGWGDAISHVRYLTDDEVVKLKNDNEYIRVYKNKEFDFSIVSY